MSQETTPTMRIIDGFHDDYVHQRRVRVLAKHLAPLIPEGATVLDVGCGDGQIACLVRNQRSDLRVEGLDVLARPKAMLPVTLFDGQKIPRADRSVDVVMFVDVLHHTDDPAVLLGEAARVARRAIVIKDHVLAGLFAGSTLRLMDWVGNARHGVALPYNYWPKKRWLAAFDALGWRVSVWQAHLGIYPWPASWLFDRSLHCLVRLEPGTTRPEPETTP